MLSGLTSTGTHAVQMWFNDRPGENEQWLEPATVGTAFTEPFNTWANMSHVLPREDWNGTGLDPQSLIYLCDASDDVPHLQSAYDPATRNAALHWLRYYLPVLWSAQTPGQIEAVWAS